MLGAQQNNQWIVPVTGRHDDGMERQLTAGGACLAQSLMAIWP